MSDQGEKTCPLCAEEMDLTDQQLKPCKCGYEICVWCWHHIMDMAEKDDTEGRCPACRVPYDKEKIVAMADNCGRLVAEISMEKKVKSQKTKLKSSEGRKQLSSVRVIQRNLVYIVGLPLDLGDEDLLHHKEYFGQYGKVLKVSMSRTASGVIQQFPNNTCSVYITYSKEEEAIRCIQSVHGFILDGRTLRACFGTTKYCHAWLRNMPCSNPDCLYLHEIGSQEDSFTKDEVVSAYTRNRVQQITGATNSLQRRAGSVLPPPVDDYSINSILPGVKSAVVNASNNSTNVVRVSPPNSSSGISAGLPPGASWGTRASNCQPPAINSASIDGSIKLKPETVGGSLVCSSAVAIAVQASKKINQDGQTLQDKGTVDSSVKHFINSENHFTPDQTSIHSIPAVKNDSESASVSSRTTHSPDNKSSGNAMEKDLNGSKSDKLPDLCADMSSIGINRDLRSKHPSSHIRTGAPLSDSSNKLPDKQEQDETEALTLDADRGSSISSNGFLEHRGGTAADSHVHAIPKMLSDMDEDVQLFNDQRLKDTEVVSRPSYLLPSLTDSLRISSNPGEFPMHHREGLGTINFDIDPSFVNSNAHEGALLPASSLVSPNGYSKNSVIGSGCFDRAVDNSFLFPHEGKVNQMGCIQGHSASLDCNGPMDMGESSIISNILSMDFDADDSLTSPQNLAKLLGETKQNGTITSSWKAHNANQSRFSFARQDTNNQLYKDPPGINVEKVQRQSSFNHSLFNGGDTYFDNGFSSGGFGPLNSSGNQACVQSNKISASRSQISAPPGFSVPNRAPPPGFSSHERMDQIFDSFSGNHLLDTSSLLRNTYNGPSSVNMTSTGDIEFMDPAILAVGKGRLQGGFNNPSLDMRSNFPAQFSAFENEAKLQLLMQRSLSSQQNLRLTDMGNGFSSIHDTYGIHPRVNDQSQASNHSPFSQLSIQQTRSGLLSNGHSDGWNDVQNGNNLGMADVLRNERLGFNKFYSGFEDSKFRMPSSGNLYNRTYGM